MVLTTTHLLSRYYYVQAELQRCLFGLHVAKYPEDPVAAALVLHGDNETLIISKFCGWTSILKIVSVSINLKVAKKFGTVRVAFNKVAK